MMQRCNWLKLRKTKKPNRYSLSYKRRKGGSTGYAILSALIGDNDVIMEINTDLSIQRSGVRHDHLIEEFIQQISPLGLKYRKRIFPSAKRLSIMGFGIQTRTTEAQEVVVYVPNYIWKKESFMEVIPQFGVRYYVTKESADAEMKMDEITAMKEEEKEDVFGMIIFDISLLGQMGIISKSSKEGEIRDLLSLRSHP